MAEFECFMRAMHKKLREVPQEKLVEMDLMFSAVPRVPESAGPLLQAMQLADRFNVLTQIAHGMTSMGFVVGWRLDNGVALALRKEGFTLWRDAKMRVIIGMPGVAREALDQKNKRQLEPLVLDEAVDVSAENVPLLPPIGTRKELSDEIARLLRQMVEGAQEPEKGFQRQFFLQQLDALLEVLVTLIIASGPVQGFPCGNAVQALYPVLRRAGIGLWLDKKTYCQIVTLPGVSLPLINRTLKREEGEIVPVPLAQ